MFKNSVRTSKKTTLHHYKDQLINAVQGNNRWFRELCEARKYNFLPKSELLIVQAGGIHSYH
jgi:hypothetical protein